MQHSNSGVTVIGSATVSTASDRVRLHLAVEQQAESGADALSRSADAARTLRSTLRDAGIDDRLVQTVGMSVDARWGDQQQVVGYFARQRFCAVTDNIEQAGELLERLGRAVGDALRIDNVEVYANDPSPAQLQAQNDAFADAAAQAEQLARQAGRSLGAVRSITTLDASGGPEIYGRAMMAAGKADAFAPGQVSIDARLQVTWDWAD